MNAPFTTKSTAHCDPVSCMETLKCNSKSSCFLLSGLFAFYETDANFICLQ